jgi:thiopurine S-methyltransferase
MMEPDFWLERWREGRIGFHQDAVTPMLERHWDAIEAPAGSRVFVPLCGKTLDMVWLAARGHRVLGVELSRLAVEQFFEEQGLVPAITRSQLGNHYGAHEFELIVGDAFAFDRDILAGCSAVLDRAALIALPENQRRRYVDTLYGRLPAGCRGLLVTLEYPQQQMQGPPFSVIGDEVRTLFADAWEVESLERRDIFAQEPHITGYSVTTLDTVAYRLQHADSL